MTRHQLSSRRHDPPADVLSRRDALRGAVLCAISSATLASGIGTANAQAVTMRIGSDVPIDAPHSVSAVKLKESVEGLLRTHQGRDFSELAARRQHRHDHERQVRHPRCRDDRRLEPRARGSGRPTCSIFPSCSETACTRCAPPTGRWEMRSSRGWKRRSIARSSGLPPTARATCGTTSDQSEGPKTCRA